MYIGCLMAKTSYDANLHLYFLVLVIYFTNMMSDNYFIYTRVETTGETGVTGNGIPDNLSFECLILGKL